MNTSNDRIQAVRISGDTLTFDMADGRSVSVPLAWYPTLLHASETERNTFKIQVWSVHWPLLDFDLGAEGLLRGARETRPSKKPVHA